MAMVKWRGTRAISGVLETMVSSELGAAGGLAGLAICDEELEAGAEVSGGMASVWAVSAMGVRAKRKAATVDSLVDSFMGSG
jgi:hypothetical protein